jgi:hypothetical protein
MLTQTTVGTISKSEISDWVQSYVEARSSNDEGSIRALFAEEATCHDEPMHVTFAGNEAIMTASLLGATAPNAGALSDWHVLSREGRTGVVACAGRDKEMTYFETLWVVTLDLADRCSRLDVIDLQPTTAKPAGTIAKRSPWASRRVLEPMEPQHSSGLV